jgi:hypothetical protein
MSYSQPTNQPKVVQYFQRNVYGVFKSYPANEPGQKFADLLGVKTLSMKELNQIEALGFKVEQVQDPATVRVAS